MDCEKFDRHVMDALYDELDELTHAAMKRHMESCARCASTLAGLRATREAAVLPLEVPSDDLEDRILAAVEVAQRRTPWRRKALRALAWAGSHAMRPQLAMAALFVLVIGSSLLLLRARPGTVGVAPVRVTERGVPAPEQPEPTPAATAPATPPAALAAAEPSEARRGASEAAQDPPAEKAKDSAGDSAEDKKAEGADGASAALEEAQAARKKSGCAGALAHYDEVGTRYPGTAAAHTAMWEAAQCYKAAGDEAKARELLMALRSVDGYRSQAESELSGAQANLQAQNAAPAPPAPAATAAPASPPAGAAAGRPAAASPAKPAAKPAADAERYSPAQQHAAPPRAADERQPSAPSGDGLAAPARSRATGF